MRCLWSAVLVLSAGCAVSVPDDVAPDATPDDLLEADRAFARETAERRLDGWMSYFAEDAVRLPPGNEVVRGLDEIRGLDAALFADDTVGLRWDPVEAGLFRGGKHGFTSGRYEVVKSEPGSPAAVVGTGTYLTIWRQDPSGWKVILDTGSPDPPAENATSE